MITYLKNEIYKTVNGADMHLIQIACKSTDSKPTTGIVTGSLALEVDSGKIYAFDEASSEWDEIGSSGGGGGGGGSSDFSTAKVTISGTIFPSNINIVVCAANFGIFTYTNAENGTYDVPLYQGRSMLEAVYEQVSISGDIIYDDDMGMFIVTGDCTIVG